MTNEKLFIQFRVYITVYIFNGVVDTPSASTFRFGKTYENPAISCQYVYILLSTTRNPRLVRDPDFLDKRTSIYVPLWMSFSRLLIPLRQWDDC